MSCGPLLLDHCPNHGALDTALLSHPTHDSLLFVDGCPPSDGVDANGQNTDDATVGPQQGCRANNIFQHEKFEQGAFGTLLLNHNGGFDCKVRSLWWKVVALRGKQYSLPDGGIGTRFVNMLSEEIERCTKGQQRSEREFIFTALVWQYHKMVSKGRDVCPLLTRWIDMWEAGKLSELLQEAQ